MGREAKRKEEARVIARKIRDEAHQAFTQSFAIMTNALAVTIVITEPTGRYDSKGIPEGQTRQFTVCHTAPEIGLEHMGKGAELIYNARQESEAKLIENREKQAAAQAAALPSPEGMEDDTPTPPEGVPVQPPPGDDGGE